MKAVIAHLGTLLLESPSAQLLAHNAAFNATAYLNSKSNMRYAVTQRARELIAIKSMAQSWPGQSNLSSNHAASRQSPPCWGKALAWDGALEKVSRLLELTLPKFFSLQLPAF